MTDKYPTDTAALLQANGGPLVCHGCGHSAGGEPYPGRPSGERPCAFCTRNVQREAQIAEARKDGIEHFAEGVYGVVWTAFYNNAAMRKCPMDCYIATDMILADVPEGSKVIT